MRTPAESQFTLVSYRQEYYQDEEDVEEGEAGDRVDPDAGKGAEGLGWEADVSSAEWEESSQSGMGAPLLKN
jgi:hypothetical protein